MINAEWKWLESNCVHQDVDHPIDQNQTVEQRVTPHLVLVAQLHLHRVQERTDQVQQRGVVRSEDDSGQCCGDESCGGGDTGERIM